MDVLNAMPAPGGPNGPGRDAAAPRLPANISYQLSNWMAEYSRLVTPVTGRTPAPGAHIEVVTPDRMGNLLGGIFGNMIASVPAPSQLSPTQQMLQGWFQAQVAKTIGRMISGRVLGLYVPEWQAPGRSGLYMVAENIERSAAELGVRPEALARFVAFHEATHQWQFTANPWLEQHMKDSLDAVIASTASVSPADMLRNGQTRGDIMALLAPIQATMSLVEGYANFLTEALAPADVAALGDRLDAEREAPQRSPLQALLSKVLQMDVKAKQYSDGKRFCAAVHAVGGHALLNKVWDNAANLPSPQEMATPQLWINRIQPSSARPAA